MSMIVSFLHGITYRRIAKQWLEVYNGFIHMQPYSFRSIHKKSKQLKGGIFMKRTIPWLLAVCMLLMFPLNSLASNALPPDWVSAYEPVLTRYLLGLQGNEEILEADDSVWTCHQCSLNAGLDPLEYIGYGFADLNGDQVPELFIGETGDTLQEAGMLFEIFTVQEDKAVSVRRGWERNRLYLTRDPETGDLGFYSEGSSGATNSVYGHALASLSDVFWADEVTLEANIPDGQSDFLWTLNGQSISAAEAEALLTRWESQVITLSLAPFSALIHSALPEEP